MSYRTTKNRTNYAPYQFTVDTTGDPDLAKLRLWVKSYNKAHPTDKRRVSIRPRLGKDNPYNYLYRVGGSPRNRYQMIKMAHGARFDVYVHRAS